MTFRKNQEMYEILNKFNAQDRWKPGTPPKASSGQTLDSIAASGNSDSDEQADTTAETTMAVASAIQNSLNPTEVTATEQQEQWVNQQEIVEDPSYAEQTLDKTQTSEQPAAAQQEPPYTFKFHPRPMSQEEDAKPFGERKFPISYDMMILGGIVFAVILVGSFILGAKLGKNQGEPNQPENNSTQNENRPGTNTEHGNTSNQANQLDPAGQGTNSANSGQNTNNTAASDTTTHSDTDGNVPPATLEKYWSIAVCSVPVPGDAAKKATVEKEFEEFRVHLEQQGFKPAWVRQVGNYFELLVGKEADRIPSDSSMMQQLQGMRFKTSQTKALYTAQPFVKSIRE